MKSPYLTATAVAGLLTAGILSAGIITPVSVTSSIPGETGSSAQWLISDNAGRLNPGLSDESGFAVSLNTGDPIVDAFCAYALRSSAGEGESWTAQASEGNPVFVFDLSGGGNVSVGSILLWHGGDAGSSGAQDNGDDTRDFSVIFHTEAEGSSFDFAGETTDYAGVIDPTLGDATLDSPAQPFFLGVPVTARYVAIRIDTNYAPPADPRITSGGNRYALGEVRFATEAVVDPRIDPPAEVVIENPGVTETLQVPVGNTGTSANLTVTDARLTGADAAAFTVLTDFASPLVIGPGNMKNIAIQFDPSAVGSGPVDAFLELDSNGWFKPTVTVPIVGFVRNPWIDTVDAIDLGVLPATAGPQAFAIGVNNLGSSASLFVFSAGFSGDPGFTVTDDLFFNPLVVFPGFPGQINLSFDSGGVTGTYQADLQIVGDDPAVGARVVPVTVTVAREPQLSAPPVVELGPYGRDAGPQSVAVTIDNLGATSSLTITAPPVVTGGDAANFSVGSYDTTISAGGSGQISLTFDAGTDAGCFATTLEVSSNDTGAPLTTIELVAEVEPQALPGSLVAWWPLNDELNPGQDASGNGFHGTAVGTPVAAAGATVDTSTALLFDGTTHVDVPWCTYLNPESFTVTLWACPTTNSGLEGVIASMDETGGGTTTHGFVIYNNDAGAWDFWTGDGDPGWKTLVGTPVTTETWTHLAITYDAATQTKRLYVNGVAVSTVTAPGLYDPNGPETESLHIGSGSDDGLSARFNGKIDDVALFATALSSAQIGAVRNNGVAGFLDPPPVALPFTLSVVGYDMTKAVVDVVGAEPGILYRVTAATELTGTYTDTGVTFTDATASGIMVNSPFATFPVRFFRAEEVGPIE